MPELSERQKEILLRTIGEYIKTGEAVSSDDVRKKYRLGYSPATIRNELRDLADLGYLMQPHTSSGRVPTDAGYRWYVTKLEERFKKHGAYRELSPLKKLTRDADEFFRMTTETLAPLVQALVIGGTIHEESFYKTGFGELLRLPEFMDQEVRNELGELIDSMDRVLNHLMETREMTDPEVFIGKENPIPAEHCSMIIQTISLGKGRGIVAILGSKRMQYERGLKFLSGIKALAESEYYG